MGVPLYAPTALINDAALHNTLEEKASVYHEAQHHRLTTSMQGREILRALGYPTDHLPPITPSPPPWESIPRITVLPIPKHMSQATDQERRASRAQHLPEPIHDTYYTDARFVDHTTTTASVGPCTAHVRHHVNVPSPTAAETQAIAEAITLHQHRTAHITVRTDSQGALRSFASNDIPSPVHTSLTTYMHAHPHLHVFLEWIPGHQGIEGNERAHALARDAHFPGSPQPWPEEYNPKEDRAMHHKRRREHLGNLRKARMVLPSPSKFMSRRHATYIRQAQTLSLPCDLFLHYIQKSPGRPHCQVCGGYPDNEHTYWRCVRATSSSTFLSTNPFPPDIPYSWSSWAAPPENLRAALWSLLAAHIETLCAPPPSPPPSEDRGTPPSSVD